MLDKIKNLKVAVIGDMMIDETIVGTSTRQSPEADVPVIDVHHRTVRPGGAANVAMAVSALGARVDLFAIPGNDWEVDRIIYQLREQGIRTFSNRFVESIKKTRVIMNGQPLARIDRGKKHSHPVEITADRLLCYDLVILSDYGYGSLSQELVDSLPKDRPYFLAADPKPRSGIIFRGMDLITPNHEELRSLTPYGADRLRQDWTIGSVVVTHGDQDTLVAYEGGVALIPTEQITAVDPCGAGDTFIAAISCAAAVGASILVATVFANQVAALAVEKPGTATVTADEVRQSSFRFQHQLGKSSALS